jgi:hypothetical protein
LGWVVPFAHWSCGQRRVGPLWSWDKALDAVVKQNEKMSINVTETGEEEVSEFLG